MSAWPSPWLPPDIGAILRALGALPGAHVPLTGQVRCAAHRPWPPTTSTKETAGV